MYEGKTSPANPRFTQMSLPKHFYTQENVYQQELMWLRENMWLLVGHESQIPHAGDYFLYEFDRDKWLVKESALEHVDFEISQVAAVWEPTLKEDKTLVENAQLGIDSTAYRPGPYIETEQWVGDFDLWYLTRIAGERRV